MKLDVLSPLPPPPTWYADGLRFTCTQCGNCCTGQPGFVWICLLYTSEPKTKKNRAVPVSSRLRFYLDKWQLKSERDKCPWLFPSPLGKRWDPDNFSADLRAANEKGKLSWGCLDFRHTFGSQLAMKGESLYKISQLMGNSPEICRRHYAALIPDQFVGDVNFAA